MNYNYWDLGTQRAGATVGVTLTGTEANVRLVDAPNFAAYKSGRNFRGVGGHYRQSPIRLEVPTAGHWFAVIDYGGFAGRGSASVQVLG